jgi:hypothetical protein
LRIVVAWALAECCPVPLTTLLAERIERRRPVVVDRNDALAFAKRDLTLSRYTFL